MPHDHPASLESAPVTGPRIVRTRHDVKSRWVSVVEAIELTPSMRRVTFAGDALLDFASDAFDDHFKLSFPSAGGVARRDYTPRRYRPDARILVVDFAIHDAGPATAWAMQATPGDEIEIIGPKSSKRVNQSDVSRWLLVGDETALPAISRMIEESEAGTEISSLIAVAGPQDEQTFNTEASVSVSWIHRGPCAPEDATLLLSKLADALVGAGTFVWIAGEAVMARRIRDHFIALGHPKGWMKAGGYWVRGQSNAHERID